MLSGLTIYFALLESDLSDSERLSIKKAFKDDILKEYLLQLFYMPNFVTFFLNVFI